MRMLTQQEFPFVGPHDTQTSPYMDPAQTINLYYEPAYTAGGAHSVPALISSPGVSAPITSLTAVPAGKNVRGFGVWNGRLFAIGGGHLYEVTPPIAVGAVGTLVDYGAITGSSTTAANVRSYIIGAPNSPGLAVQNEGAVASVNIIANTTTKQISGSSLEFLDGFWITTTTDGSLVGNNQNQVNCSAFNDPTTWPALAFILKEGSFDALMNLAVVNNLLWIFGQSNIEIWYNAGLPNFPFARVNGGTINVGCMCAQAVVKINNGVIWLGASERGRGIVYLSRGSFIPTRISTTAIEQYIQAALPVNSALLATSYAFTYQEAGHEFYELVIPGFLALVYDITFGVWHARSQGGTNQNSLGTNDLPFCAAMLQNNPANAGGLLGTSALTQPGVVVGDSTSGNIYFYGRQFKSMNGTAIFRMRTAPHISDGLRWMKYPSFEVDADVGTATLNLFYSNNGGKTYANLNRPDAAKTSSNDQGSNTAGGTYPRFRWTQLGRSRRRSYGVWILDANNPIALINAAATINEGNERLMHAS